MKTDISTGLGIICALLLVFAAISLGGNIFAFIDIPSILIVIVGTSFLTIASFNISDFFKSIALVFKTTFYNSEEAENSAMLALQIADKARSGGLLSLQKYEENIEGSGFFKRGISFIVDGIPFEEIDRMMREEIDSMIERHKKGIAVLRKAAEIAPAMGLIGTLIGLVQMLGHLDDPATIGPSMAVALLTTLYGAILAYMVFTPLASKLEKISRAEADIMDIYLLAINSIGKKENPRRLEMLINSVLSPVKRVKYFK